MTDGFDPKRQARIERAYSRFLATGDAGLKPNTIAELREQAEAALDARAKNPSARNMKQAAQAVLALAVALVESHK